MTFTEGSFFFPQSIEWNMITAKKRTISAYEQAVQFLPMFKDKLSAVSPHIREKAKEIRLRAGQPVIIELIADRHILNTVVTAQDLKNLIEIFCDYSIHSYAKQISEGFITLGGGHRAGFCGTAVVSGNRVETIREITSINLRIAREFVGCSALLYDSLPIESMQSLLIIGKPVSAKTTVLRDFARNLSQSGYKVAVIDERGEIAAKHKGIIGMDLGTNTDVLDNFPKKAGFITALRVLSPDFIVCDEIGGVAESEEIAECLNSGVGLITTAHCGSIEETLRSRSLSGIMEHINYAALLGTGKDIGKLQGLYRKDRKSEGVFCNILSACRNSNGLIPLGGA